MIIVILFFNFVFKKSLKYWYVLYMFLVISMVFFFLLFNFGSFVIFNIIFCVICFNLFLVEKIFCKLIYFFLSFVLVVLFKFWVFNLKYLFSFLGLLIYCFMFLVL